MVVAIPSTFSGISTNPKEINRKEVEDGSRNPVHFFGHFNSTDF